MLELESDRSFVCGVCSLSETRSQNTEKLSVDQAAAVLLNFLQQAREGGELRVCFQRGEDNEVPEGL